ncbi:MAG: DUF6188 family protein [Armatimonadota bacterium]
MSKIANLIEQPESWIVPLFGYEITLCCVGYNFQLHLQCNDLSSLIAIGDKIVLQIGDKRYNYSVETNPSALGPVLGLLHKTIESVTALKNGQLSIIISDEISLSVFPDISYEAWEVSISNGIRIVCMPGGTLAIWDKH